MKDFVDEASSPQQRLPGSDVLRLAVLIPCHNEGTSIASVVSDFRRYLPEAEIYVYDNNSNDDTGLLASGSGAHVRREVLQGKGHVVRRMFSDVDADIYVLVDGDGTYDAASAPGMIRMLLQNRLDMVNGARVNSDRGAYRRGHRTGNLVLSGVVARIFGGRITDMLSGYRVFSRRFVKSFPALSSGFEIETELTVHALELRVPLGEMPTPYRERAEGGASKLRTYSDGLRILRTIVWLIKQERPLQFFSIAFLMLFLLGVTLSIPVLLEYQRTGMVPRFPTAILSMGIVLLSFLSLACGLILDSVTLGRKEAKRMVYLSIPYLPAGVSDAF
ncbi:MAG TPA: glycosyltransferase [Acidobacteriaceae bacterium]|nr:glycosyltransferase [Acidobacteriaceae bacterium]